MVARTTSCAACLLLLVSCRGDFTTPPRPTDTEGARPRCASIGQPLSITPTSASVGSGQLFVLDGVGGTGDYRWSLLENPSGGAIDPAAGVYVAGVPDPSMTETRDQVVLEDRGCRGDASALLTVVTAPSLAPARIAIEPGQSVTFRVEGGTGAYAFSLVDAPSGGSIDAASGRYTAGASVGRDIVRVTDTGLDSSAEALVEVVADAALSLSPTHWVIPVGGTVALPVTGGSELYDVAITGGFESIEGGGVRATSAGAGSITFTDRFTARTATATLTAFEPHDASRQLGPDRAETHLVRSADVDGDGDLDAIVGMEQANGDWYESGVVLIYLNEGGALETEPRRVLSGYSRSEEFGMDVQLADLDGDGLIDLLVGARRADPIRVDIGAVYVYGGVEGGVDGEGVPFTREPVRTFFGSNAYDLFGDSIAVCDFNGDGRLDLAVTAPYGQDPDGLRDQGVLQVFLAYPGGRFLSSPDVQIFGVGVGAMGVGPIERMRLGEGLAAGDYDGDGVCDLAAYAVQAQADVRDTGAVFLYRGQPEAGDDRGGPEETPRLIWARADTTDDNAYFGQDLLMGDVNGDGRADLVATRYLYDGAAGTDTGGIYVRYGREFSEAATSITDIDAGADWRFEGLAADRVGNAAALFDVDGDGQLDVLSGDSRAEVMDGAIDRPGMIRVFRGGGDLSVSPDLEYEGPVSGARFGLGLGGIGDLDGDGRSELLAFAPYRDSAEGVNDDLGALYLRPSTAAEATELSLPRRASGQLAGRSTVWLGDLNGDGFPELAVGAPRADVVGLGRNVGVVRVYAGTATGVASAPTQELSGFTGHSDSDEFGWQVAAAGDFDGDGVGDLAVLSRGEDLPETLAPETFAPVGTCARRDNPGVLYVFRGRADGTVEPEPMLLYYGPIANQRIEDLLGGVDVNGDMLDDIVVGGREWDVGGETNVGGVAVIYGRAAASDGRILAVCTPDVRVDGTEAGARLGDSLASMGDLDADGCEDFAAGAPESDPGEVRNAGAVHVFFGFDGSAAMRCGPRTRLTRTVLVGRDRDAQAGLSVAGGANLFGDGSPDLVVGAPRYRDGRGEVGRALLVDGARIAANVGATIPLLAATPGVRLIADGRTAGERFGASVSTTARSGSAFVAVGGPFGGSSGVVNTGGALVFEVSSLGLGEAARIQVAGESRGRGSLGSNLDLRAVGGRVYLGVGAEWSSMVASDDGASYAFVFTP